MKKLLIILFCFASLTSFAQKEKSKYGRYRFDSLYANLESPNDTADKHVLMVNPMTYKVYKGPRMGNIGNGGAPTWGAINGTLADQSDLASELNGKQSSITTGTTLQYFRGDLSLATFPTTTAAFTSSTNKNFVTDANLVVIGNTSGTNSGDNSANSTYANDFRAANFIAGTNYLAPNGSASALTNFPTFNQNTTGSAATLTTPRTIQGVSFNGSANINIINGTGFVKATGTTISYDNSSYQPIATNLTSIGALANGNGYLKNNGSGTFTYETPAGAGTVTSVSVVTANGISGNVATATSTPAITLTLGAITPTTVNGHTFTTGSSTFTGTAGQTYTFPAVTSTLLPNTTTSGVAATVTASGTTTVTHNLGRVPTTIRIYSISSFTSNAAATPVPFSNGIWNSSGNRCVYMVINGTTTQVSQTSTTFSIIMVTSAGNQITGVIQNVTSTGFDIVWTETGTHTAGNYMWEAQ